MSKFQPYEVSYDDETAQYHYDGNNYSNLDDLLVDIGYDIELNTKEKSIDQKLKELKADLENAIRYTEELQKKYMRLTGRRFIPDIVIKAIVSTGKIKAKKKMLLDENHMELPI